MFGIFSSRPAINFGDALARKFSERYPPSLDKPDAPKISANRLGRILESLFAEAQAYRAEHKLGYYRRTRLSHAFKWRLMELGYSKPLIDMATEGLVVYLHKPMQDQPDIREAQVKRSRKAARNKELAVSPPSATSPSVGATGSSAFSRTNPSPRYTELTRLYRQMHEEGEAFLDLPPEETFPGLSLPPQAARIKRLIDSTKAAKILDYGSGKGLQYQARNLAIPGIEGRVPSIKEYWEVAEIRCYDPSYTPYSTLPSGAFDGVVSTDVLEHCPEEDVPWILDEIFSYARKFVFANVACYPARKRLPTGENAHCTIRPREWWESQIKEVTKRHNGVEYEFWIQWKEAEGNIIEEVIRG